MTGDVALCALRSPILNGVVVNGLFCRKHFDIQIRIARVMKADSNIASSRNTIAHGRLADRDRLPISSVRSIQGVRYAVHLGRTVSIMDQRFSAGRCELSVYGSGAAQLCAPAWKGNSVPGGVWRVGDRTVATTRDSGKSRQRI